MISSDIKFYHSGGALNSNPEDDLGGIISNFELSNSIENLFDSLNATESYDGLIDYRCFYVKNTNISETFRNTKIYIDQKISGSYIQMGMDLKNEIQSIEISGSPNEGDTLTLNVNNQQFTTIYSYNLVSWKKNFQNEIRSINGLNDVIIDVSGSVPDVLFTVNFLGQSSNKKFDLINVVNNNLTNCIVNVAEIQEGSPINRTANTIATKYDFPDGVNFSNILRGNPIIIGNLEPDDNFAIWIKRITQAKTIKKTRDNFKINIIGN